MRSLAVLLALFLGLTASSAAGGAVFAGERLEVAATSFDSDRFVGRRLGEALLELRDYGVRVVFTDRVVPRSLRVEGPIVAHSAEDFLALALDPHGLRAIVGARGTWVVVAEDSGLDRTPRPTLSGYVRTAETLDPVAGARVRILPSGAETRSDLEGGFELSLETDAEYSVVVDRLGYLPATLRGASAREEFPPVLVLLEAAPVVKEEVVVKTSQFELLAGEGQGLSLGDAEIEALPHLGGDLFRALSLLPGASSNDVSANFHVRGGRRDETRILLDGMELIEPFHLTDYDEALSVISPSVLGRASLSTGGFDARYGDRMSGVLDLATKEPGARREFRLGLGLANANVGGSGALRSGRGHWIADYRRGSIDLIGRLLGEEDPEYWDAFGKFVSALSPRQNVRAHALFAGDRLDFGSNDGVDIKSLSTRYDRQYLWATHGAVLGERTLLETTVGFSRVERDRRGEEIEPDVELIVRDLRDLDVLDLRQTWSHQWSPRGSTEFGAEYRRYDAQYDYTLETLFDSALADLREHGPDDARRFEGRFEDRHTGLYVSDRRLLSDRFSLQLGLRYDRYSLVDEEHVSPRFGLSWRIGESYRVRFSWGEYVQSQRVNELLVEDDDVRLFPVERAEHLIVGLERDLEIAGHPVTARIEAYRREVEDPRPRYVNLYEPINTFPEAEPDRIRIDPDRGRAEGIEFFVRGRGDRIGWWVNYTLSSSEDRISGVDIPRRIDQTHALNIDFDLELGRRWKLNLAWSFHTGWPTTPISLVETLDDDGEIEFVPVLGPRNSDRLPDYHRLDARVSRTWDRRWGEVRFFADIQNLYDRTNVSGFDFEIDDEVGALGRSLENWSGVLPSAGVEIRF